MFTNNDYYTADKCHDRHPERRIDTKDGKMKIKFTIHFSGWLYYLSGLSPLDIEVLYALLYHTLYDLIFYKAS